MSCCFNMGFLIFSLFALALLACGPWEGRRITRERRSILLMGGFTYFTDLMDGMNEE